MQLLKFSEYKYIIIIKERLSLKKKPIAQLFAQGGTLRAVVLPKSKIWNTVAWLSYIKSKI